MIPPTCSPLPFQATVGACHAHGGRDGDDARLVRQARWSRSPRDPAHAALFARVADLSHRVVAAVLKRFPNEHEDVVADAALEFFRSGLHRFDPARGSLATYVSAIARGRALNRLRQLGLPAIAGAHIAPAGPHAPALEAWLDARRSVGVVARRFRALPPRQRDALAECLDDTAAPVGPLGPWHTNRCRARKALRDALRAEGLA